jgi:hypothetical protein
MRDFTKISPRVWYLKEFQVLAAREKLQYLFLYSGPHQNSSGCSYIRPAHASADLDCKVAEYLRVNDKLASCELIRVDVETSEVMILDWFKFNVPMNEKHRTGTLRQIESIASNELRTLSREAMDMAWSSRLQLARRIAERSGEISNTVSTRFETQRRDTYRTST